MEHQVEGDKYTIGMQPRPQKLLKSKKTNIITTFNARSLNGDVKTAEFTYLSQNTLS